LTSIQITCLVLYYQLGILYINVTLK